MGVNNLPKVVAQQRRGRELLTSRPSSRKSSALTATLPSHMGLLRPVHNSATELIWTELIGIDLITVRSSDNVHNYSSIQFTFIAAMRTTGLPVVVFPNDYCSLSLSDICRIK